MRASAAASLALAAVMASAEDGGYPACEPTRRAINVPDTGRRAWLEELTREVEDGPGR